MRILTDRCGKQYRDVGLGFSPLLFSTTAAAVLRPVLTPAQPAPGNRTVSCTFTRSDGKRRDIEIECDNRIRATTCCNYAQLIT